MNFSSKHSNLVIFILFVVLIFLLFATIANSSQETGKTAATILMILLLILGLSWFLINSKVISETDKIFSSDKDQKEAHRIAEQSQSETEINESENVKSIDLTNFLPKKYQSIEDFSEQILQKLANEFNLVQGLMYIKNMESELYEPIAQYAYFSENKPLEFRLGETLPGQAVKNRTVVTLSDIPENYMTIASGLGKSSTKYLVMVPLISKDEVVGLIEYATFIPVKDDTSKTLVSIAEMVADTIVKLLKK